MIDDLIAQLDALGEDDFYYSPATTKAKINEAKAALKSKADRLAELEAEVKMWRDENFKKQTAYQQRGVRIAELEVALRAVNWRLLQTYELGKCQLECLRIIEDALEGGEDG